MQVSPTNMYLPIYAKFCGMVNGDLLSQMLQENGPILFDLLTTTDVPSSALSLFQEIAEKCEAPFVKEDCTFIPAHPLPLSHKEYPGNTFQC